MAGGDQQEKSICKNISSPTVSQESVMMVIAIAAAEDQFIETCDVTGAFLEAEMPLNYCKVLISLDATCASILCELDRDAICYVWEDGVIHVKPRQALYGCVQSSKLWSDKNRLWLRR